MLFGALKPECFRASKAFMFVPNGNGMFLFECFQAKFECFLFPKTFNVCQM